MFWLSSQDLPIFPIIIYYYKASTDCTSLFSPDKNPFGEEKFKRILEAYRFLSDEQKRREYDEKSAAGQQERQRSKAAHKTQTTHAPAKQEPLLKRCFKCFRFFKQVEYTQHLWSCKRPKPTVQKWKKWKSIFVCSLSIAFWKNFDLFSICIRSRGKIVTWKIANDISYNNKNNRLKNELNEQSK